MNNTSSELLAFAKMQALGNDFIILDGEELLEAASMRQLLQQLPLLAPQLARQLCSRHFGIGANGLVLALNLKEKALAKIAQDFYGGSTFNCELAWIFLNNDGSFAEQCGNAMRCLTLWAHSKGLITSQAHVLTTAGPIAVSFQSQDSISVDLGAPRLLAKDIPFTGLAPDKSTVKHSLKLDSTSVSITCVNMANPHCVIFPNSLPPIPNIELPLAKEEQLQSLPLSLIQLAEKIQASSQFPQGVNVSFVLEAADNHASALVFERGCGPTMACGSAACAIVVAGVLEQKLERQATITLPGGKLMVDWSDKDNHVHILGPARLSFHGQWPMQTTAKEVNGSASVAVR